MTAVPRTLLDLAAAVKFELLEKLLERSEEKGVFDLRAVEDLLARTVGHHGHKRLRRAISLYRPTSFTRSGLEKRFLELVIEAELPQPHTNYVEHGFELDFYWREHRFVVELDVFETHGTRAAFEREPEKVIRRVARLLEQRRDS